MIKGIKRKVQEKLLIRLVSTITHLGIFIQALRVSLKSATERRDEERARVIMSEKCEAYSVGSPQEAGNEGAHFGWHTTLHSAN